LNVEERREEEGWIEREREREREIKPHDCCEYRAVLDFVNTLSLPWLALSNVAEINGECLVRERKLVKSEL